LYFSAQARTCGSTRWQLMQAKVQKSTNTTLPRSDWSASGDEFNQEGNALTPELKLEQIRLKTAVFSMPGTRFEVPL
jgi:hypothetical protein